jgi:hypothetical protein
MCLNFRRIRLSDCVEDGRCKDIRVHFGQSGNRNGLFAAVSDETFWRPGIEQGWTYRATIDIQVGVEFHELSGK